MHQLMTSREMAKIACASCEGCGDCCRGMDDTIHLDPYDMYTLSKGLTATFDRLLEKRISLHVEEGLVLPHLLMGQNGACTFLGPDGRCSIHAIRPGFCRLFPLGREYDGEGFAYFVVEGGCPRPGKSPVRIRKWLDIPDLPRYEGFISDWHYFTGDVKKLLRAGDNADLNRRIALFILETFYVTPYRTGEDFYNQFYERLEKAAGALHLND